MCNPIQAVSSPLRSNYSKQPLRRTSNTISVAFIHWRCLKSRLPANHLIRGLADHGDPSSLELFWFHRVREQWRHGAWENSPWWGRFSFFFFLLKCWARLSCRSFNNGRGALWQKGETCAAPKTPSGPLLPSPIDTQGEIWAANSTDFVPCTAHTCTFSYGVPGVRVSHTHRHTDKCMGKQLSQVEQSQGKYIHRLWVGRS